MINATFNNISDVSWRSVLLVEETTDLPQVTVNPSKGRLERDAILSQKY